MSDKNDQEEQQTDDTSGFGMPRPADAAAGVSVDGNGTDNSSVPSVGNDVSESVPVAVVTPTVEKVPAETLSIGGADDLLSIKQGALQHLSPLIDHLDQTPEERFKTTMMMIQASDDQSLVKPAYEAAQKIEDDKARAQALLDIVNEINYFTQQHSS